MFDLGKIFSFFKKHFSRKNVVLILLLVTLYFLTRLINLEKFPIFTDEGIYIRWAKVAWQDASWRFISLTDGKQPLHVWGIIPFLKLFPNNPLLAGRLFSVASGFGAMAGMFVLLFYLFGTRAALWGSFFYLLTPYFLFYDRMALVDSAVNAGFIWILFFSILMVRTLRLDVTLIFGMICGFSLLAKSSVKLFLGLSALAPILVIEKNLKRFIKTLFNFSFLYLVVLFLGILIYNVQRLSPFLHFVAEKNKTFVMTFNEFLKTPFIYFSLNSKIIPWYVFYESAFVLPVLALFGLFLLWKKDLRLTLYLLIWLLVPYLAIALFAKVVFPRYLIFFASLFVLFASFFLIRNKKKIFFMAAIILFLLSAAYFDYTILFDQKNIPFPQVDRGQYIEGVPAGWGIKEIIDFARKKSREKPVILLAEGNFGVVGDMLSASLRKDDTVEVRGYWPLDEKNLIENQKDLKEKYVYVVFSHRMEFPQEWPIKLIRKFEKPKGQSAFHLFELLP